MAPETPLGDIGDGELPAIDAASVLLLRDGDDGLEVFLLERHLESDFAGGAFVFPGGKVDDADRTLDPACWTGLGPAAAAALTGTDEPGALGLHVAAVRETFEEAGVLLATRAGRPVTADDLASRSFRTARARLNERGTRWDWSGWLADESLVLDLAALGMWSWWATPAGAPKRFDTRFFAAAVPTEQAAALGHDEVETTGSRWATPAGALAAHEAGQVVIIFPTRHNLAALAQHGDVAAVQAAIAAGRVDRRRIQPSIVRRDGVIMVQHPDGGAPSPI